MTFFDEILCIDFLSSQLFGMLIKKEGSFNSNSMIERTKFDTKWREKKDATWDLDLVLQSIEILNTEQSKETISCKVQRSSTFIRLAIDLTFMSHLSFSLYPVPSIP